MHSHDHSHSHGQEVSAEERLALLKYMVQHNAHHAEELHGLTHRLEAMDQNNAAALLDMALDAFQQGNERLEAAIACLKKGE